MDINAETVRLLDNLGLIRLAPHTVRGLELYLDGAPISEAAQAVGVQPPHLSRALSRVRQVLRAIDRYNALR